MKIHLFVHILILLTLCLVGCQADVVAPDSASVQDKTVVAEVANEPEAVPTELPPTSLPPMEPPPTEPSPTELPPTEPPVPTASPEPTSQRIPSAGLFTLASEEPVIYHNDTAAAPMKLAFPGATVYHDGQFHMFHNELAWWPAQVHVFYSTSPDGVNWTRVTEEPIFLGEALNVPYTAFVSSVIVEPDGTWVLYFYTVDRPVVWGVITVGSIGRVTAPAPTGPWTADAEMALTPGGQDAWDSLAVQNPSVVRIEQGYVMYYTGYSERQSAIGMATSADGIHWTKQEDPVLTGSGEQGGWDAGLLLDPQVVLTPDGWVMLYARSYQVGKQHGAYGFAVSADGVNWVRSEEPIASGSTVGPFIWSTDLLYHDGVYFVYVESGRVSGMGTSFSDTSTSSDADWNIFLLTHEGSLLQ